MRTFAHRSLLAVAALACPVGCDRGNEAASPPASTPPATTSAQNTPPQLGTAKPPTTEPAVDRKFPEDLTIDPDRDPRVRAKAKELNAISVTGMKDLKAGDEVVVLVRADRGGGTIYGSGPYTIDSQLRKAVIHAGALEHQQLGLVRVKVIKFDGEHASEPRNGITPTKYGKYHTSYTIEKIDVP